MLPREVFPLQICPPTGGQQSGSQEILAGGSI